MESQSGDMVTAISQGESNIYESTDSSHMESRTSSAHVAASPVSLHRVHKKFAEARSLRAQPVFLLLGYVASIGVAVHFIFLPA